MLESAASNGLESNCSVSVNVSPRDFSARYTPIFVVYSQLSESEGIFCFRIERTEYLKYNFYGSIFLVTPTWLMRIRFVQLFYEYQINMVVNPICRQSSHAESLL